MSALNRPCRVNVDTTGRRPEYVDATLVSRSDAFAVVRFADDDEPQWVHVSRVKAGHAPAPRPTIARPDGWHV